MAVNLSFIGGAGWQFFDDNGVPLAGGKIYTYAAGTTTPQTTYTSYTGVTPNTNPIVLDAAGRTPQQIWATEGLLYKYAVYTANNVLIRNWDNIGGTVVANDLAQDLASTTDNAKGDALIGFKQSNAAGFLTGATARTVNDKLQETVSVRDFGATGDGITDDSVAVQAAVNASTSVYFPTGTYILRNILVPANTNIFGDKTATLKLKALAGGDFSPILNLQGSNIEVRSLKFNGNRVNQPLSPFGDTWGGLVSGGKANRVAIYGDVLNATTAVTNLFVFDCEFTEFYGSSIATRDASHLLVSSCYFHDNNFESCFFYQQFTNIIPHENAQVIDCTHRNIFSGSTFVNADVLVISGYTGVVVQNNYADTYDRLLVKLEICSDVNITNNYATNALLFGGIGVQAGGNNFVISGNTIRNCFGNGIGFTGSLPYTNVVIENNIIDITKLVTPTSVSDGIVLTVTHDCLIVGNKIRSPGRHGISLSNCSTGDFAIHNNDVSISPTASSVVDCIIMGGFSGDVRSISITGNVCNQNGITTTGAINITSTGITISHLKISNNICYNLLAGGRAIFTNGSLISNGVIDNNLCGNGLVEAYSLAGGTLVALNNVTPRAVIPTGVNTRLLPTATAAPIAGTYYVGDVVYTSSPTAGGNIGWVCVSGGTPGTWRTFGAIA